MMCQSRITQESRNSNKPTNQNSPFLAIRTNTYTWPLWYPVIPTLFYYLVDERKRLLVQHIVRKVTL